MNVIPIDPKGDREEKHRQDMLEVLEGMRVQIEEGRIVEFVAASLSEHGDAQIHVCTYDLPGSIGLYEIGKHILISQEA